MCKLCLCHRYGKGLTRKIIHIRSPLQNRLTGWLLSSVCLFVAVLLIVSALISEEIEITIFKWTRSDALQSFHKVTVSLDGYIAVKLKTDDHGFHTLGSRNQIKKDYFAGFLFIRSEIHHPTRHVFGVGVHQGILITLEIVLVTLIIRKTYSSSLGIRRQREGLCISCGYDLRASESSCPECGRSFQDVPSDRDVA